MKSAHYRHDLEIFWEQVDDPEVELHLRRAIELVLSDPQPKSLDAFDNADPAAHDEGVPAENTNPNQST